MLVLVGTHLAFAVLLFLAFGFNSYHPTDHGFTLGASWRIAQGEVPYRDFIWLRPPGTPYLHAVAMLLPDTWTLPATRLVFYLQMTGSALLPAMAWLRSGAARSPGFLALASLLGLCIALHNFPVMAWYTADAVLAGSAGMAALVLSITSPRDGVGWRVVASLSLFAAALFKQPFAVLPVLLLVWSGIEAASRTGSERSRLVLASFLPGALLWLAIGLALAGAGALSDAVDQLTRSARLEDLIQAGWLAYGTSPQPGMAVLGGVVAWIALAAPPERRAPWLLALSTSLFLAAVLWLAAISGRAGHPLFHLLLGAGVVRGIVWLRSPDRMGDDPNARMARARLVFHGGVLAIGWCASISWSQQTPLLGLAGAAVALEDLVPRPSRVWLGRLGLAAAGLTAFGFFAFANIMHPYRDAPLSRQTAALHEILPRFGRVYTHSGHAERFRDLTELIERHATNPERPFTVMRSFPAIHFLTGRRSPVRTDWYLPLDVRGFQQEHREELVGLSGIVFFQREPYVGRTPLEKRPETECTEAEFGSSPNFLQAVFRAGRVLESTRAFCVVEMPGR